MYCFHGQHYGHKNGGGGGKLFLYFNSQHRTVLYFILFQHSTRILLFALLCYTMHIRDVRVQ